MHMSKVFFIITLTISTCALNGMKFNDKSMSPDEQTIVKNIIAQLAQIIVVPPITNEKNIPVIVRHIKSFSLGNKKLHKEVNSPEITCMLISTL